MRADAAFDVATLQSAVTAVLNDPSRGELLRTRADACVGRIVLDDVTSLIFKCWRRRGMRRIAHRFLHMSSMQREWEALERLYVSGIPAPEPIAQFAFEFGACDFTHCIVERDLGDLLQSTDYIKQCISRHDEDALHDFDTDLIDLTRNMLDEHVVDPDHRLINILVGSSGNPYRIDLELAHVYRMPTLHVRALGLMLGRLLGSYAFAVQPDEKRFARFADRLMESIKPPRLSLAVIRRTVRAMLDRQVSDMGITFQPDMQLD